ncbi:MAG: hypothetical protein AAGA85_14470 [Bacteroidota bacterium]
MKDIRIGLSDTEKDFALDILSTFPLADSLEIVPIEDTVRNSGRQRYIEVDHGLIVLLPEWYNQSTPFLFPPLPLTSGNLLGLVFHLLGLSEDALQISQEDKLYPLLSGLYLGEDHEWMVNSLDGYHFCHNRAVLGFYHHSEEQSTIEGLFQDALKQTGHKELRAFTLRCYKSFCNQTGRILGANWAQDYPLAEGLVTAAYHAHDTEDLKALLSHSQTHQLPIPTSVWPTFEDTLTFYRDSGAELIVAELLNDMATARILNGDYAQAVQLIDEAIFIYSEEAVTELLVEMYIAKGAALHQWAKVGAPQQYTLAVSCYQQALGLFSKDEAPYWFADIHHRLGVLYAEMPEEQQKRAIWAAVSASSFQEALGFFERDLYPVEYATVCHNYATALINYPASLKSDNIEKALHMLNEALAIRDEHSMPRERAMTLLNYLEASWEANNINTTMESVRIKDMSQKAAEAARLTDDPFITSRAQQHLASIEQLEIQKTDA